MLEVFGLFLWVNFMESPPSNKGCRFKLILQSLSPAFGFCLHSACHTAHHDTASWWISQLPSSNSFEKAHAQFKLLLPVQICCALAGRSESTLTSAPPFHTLSDKISVKCVVVDAYSLLNWGLGTAHPTVSFSRMRTEGHGGVFSHNRDKPSGINYSILNWYTFIVVQTEVEPKSGKSLQNQV